jgi:hypothetical protein
MTDDSMDIDPPPKPVNAMAALMAGAKGKAKADGVAALSEKQQKDLNEREGLPW